MDTDTPQPIAWRYWPSTASSPGPWTRHHYRVSRDAERTLCGVVISRYAWDEDWYGEVTCAKCRRAIHARAAGEGEALASIADPHR